METFLICTICSIVLMLIIFLVKKYEDISKDGVSGLYIVVIVLLLMAWAILKTIK